MDNSTIPSDKAGWPMGQWLPLAGISRATYYALPEEKRPHSLKIGRSRVVTESPKGWLDRVALDGDEIKTKRAGAARRSAAQQSPTA